MLEKLHDHLVHELGQSSRADTIFIVVGIAFNLILLGINSATASAAKPSRYSPYNIGEDIIFGVLILITLLINAIAVTGLLFGRDTRAKLLKGLMAMYAAKGVAKYYDKTLTSNYATRYLLFSAAIGLLGVTAVLVPLVVRFS